VDYNESSPKDANNIFPTLRDRRNLIVFVNLFESESESEKERETDASVSRHNVFGVEGQPLQDFLVKVLVEFANKQPRTFERGPNCITVKRQNIGLAIVGNAVLPLLLHQGVKRCCKACLGGIIIEAFSTLEEGEAATGCDE